MKLRRETVLGLSEEERGCLLYILNFLFPTPNIELSIFLVPSLKYEVLKAKLAAARERLTEEGKSVFESMRLKLGIDF